MGDNGGTSEKISVQLGSLSVTVKGADGDEVEERFSRVWQRVSDDAAEMSDALKTLRGWE